MPLSPKHERFSQALAEGKSQTEAYQLAGYAAKPSAAKDCASRLAAKPAIKQRLASILQTKASIVERATAKAVAKLEISRTDILRELWENSQQAKAAVPVKDHEGNETGEFNANWSASNRALELLGKELGMFIDRKEIRSGPLENLTDEQLDRVIRDAVAEREADIAIRAARRTAAQAPESTS